MTYSSTQFSTSRRMSVYDTLHQVSMWEDSFNVDSSHATTVSTIVEAKIDNKLGGSSHEMLEPSRSYDQESSKPTEKMLRRLAQNREAARKSRLRKKAYVHQLETSRLKLTQVEQELQRARQQGAYVGGGLEICHSGASATINPGIAKFEMEYEHWVEEQNRLIAELRNALQAHEIELRMFVDSSIKHYYKLFRMKAAVAKDDVIYLMSGMWKTSSERFFMWIGGFRPTIILKVLIPQLEPYAEQQFADVCNLQISCQQFEDALSQGMDRLQLTLAETLAPDPSVTGSYMSQMTASMEKLEALVRFVNQADNLRQQTMQQMSRILTPRQAARALLALGDYMHRLRALSSLWAARPREPP